MSEKPSVFVRVLHGGHNPGDLFTAHPQRDPVQVADDRTQLAPGGVHYECAEIESPEHPDARRFEVLKLLTV